MSSDSSSTSAAADSSSTSAAADSSPPDLADSSSTSAAADSDIAVGQIGRAHGVRGEAFVQPWTDTPEDRFVPGAVLRTDPADRGPLTVAGAKNHSGKLVVSFSGIESRGAVEELRGTMLIISASQREPIADPDEFYDTDLIGLRVLDMRAVDLGAVTDVLHSAAGSVLVIEVAGHEALVPFQKSMVPTVSLALGHLVIDPPEGLLEL